MASPKTQTHNMLSLATAKGKEYAHLPPDKEGGLWSATIRKTVLSAALAAVETLPDLRSLHRDGEEGCRLVGALLQAGGCLRSAEFFLKACEAVGWKMGHKSIPDWSGLVGREIKSREKAMAKEAKIVANAQAVADAAGVPDQGPAGKKKGGKKPAGKKPAGKKSDKAPTQEQAQEAPAPTV